MPRRTADGVGSRAMRAVAQRVSSARVVVDSEVVGEIGRGLLVYLGAGRRDGEAEAEWMAAKLAGLRIFADDADKMSLDVRDTGGAVLLVSQFTLYGDVRRGRRPSFDDAAEPERAKALYELVGARLRGLGLTVATGRFRAMMDVQCSVAGPVTIMIDSEKTF
jgi:D-tyrosyl-tRNA(Tyr) deacylase